jgi:ABC-type transport system substrate-binding protein
MSSSGYWAYFQSYSNPQADDLIARGIASTSPSERQQIYDQLAQIYYDDCPGLLLDQPIGNRYFQDWVQGYYYNPAEPDQAGRIQDLKKKY